MVKKVFLVIFVLFCLGAITGVLLIYYSAMRFSEAIEGGLNNAGSNSAYDRGQQ